MQSSFGEEEREKIFFSTDVHWHCESSKDLCNDLNGISICDQIWENVHSSHIRFYTFKGS